MPTSTLTMVPLAYDQWPAVERLFGESGACGGCWCMHWRIEKGERWDDVKGSSAKLRLKHLVLSGKAQGMLAFDGDDAVGWCAFGPRTDFVRLDRARSLACDDASEVWSIPCFFVRRDHRGQGVAALLLKAALVELRKRGVRVAEGYPVKPYGQGKIPAAFAWTGVPSLFEANGFHVVAEGSKVRMRKALRPLKRRAAAPASLVLVRPPPVALTREARVAPRLVRTK